MKKIAISYVCLPLLLLMPLLVYAQERKAEGMPPALGAEVSTELKVDPFMVPWKAGDIVVRGQLEDEVNVMGQAEEVYRQFLGMTPEGFYRVQSFFSADGIKLTDPYVVLSLEAVVDPRFSGYEREVQGDYVQWYHNGREHAKYHYQKGKLNGLQSSWYENGRKLLEITFVNNLAQGKATIWDSDGFKISEVVYLDNQVKEMNNYAYGQYLIAHYVMDEDGGGSQVTYWFKNGSKESEGALRNDLKQGVWTSWYENGQMRSQGAYQNDEKIGSWKHWDENGVLTPSDDLKP